MQRSTDNPSAEDRWAVQVRKGVLELVVLAALVSGRLYGLELIRRLQAEANLMIPEGTLYPLLNRLHADGAVDAHWVASESGHPRKYYELTPDGRRRAQRMAGIWKEFTTGLAPILKGVESGRSR